LTAAPEIVVDVPVVGVEGAGVEVTGAAVVGVDAEGAGVPGVAAVGVPLVEDVDPPPQAATSPETRIVEMVCAMRMLLLPVVTLGVYIVAWHSRGRGGSQMCCRHNINRTNRF
jgi:hypothetical protein